MTVGEAIAWLEEGTKSRTPVVALASTAALRELRRLNSLVETTMRELNKRDEARKGELAARRRLESTLLKLEGEVRREREGWDATRRESEQRLANIEERLRLAEGTLRDVHYGLLHQPEVSREQIAEAIAGVVEPYTPGERPQ